MKQIGVAFRGIALACALCAASVPALAQSARQQGDPPQWYSDNPVHAGTLATVKKEIRAAYAEQKRACRHQAKGERKACMQQARQTYRDDMAHAPQLAVQATMPVVTERMVVTVLPDDSSGAASAVGSSQGGATGSGGAQDGAGASGASASGSMGSGTGDDGAHATGTPTGDAGAGAMDPASGHTPPMEPPPVSPPPRSDDMPDER